VSTTATARHDDAFMDDPLMLHPNRNDVGLLVGLFHSLLNIPINYQASIHPMALLPSIASRPSNIADLLSKPLSCHRFDTLIGDISSPTPTTSVVSPLVAFTATVAPPTLVAPTVDSSAATVVASAPTVPSATSDSVPSLHPNFTLPIVLDTGASYSRAPSASDFLPVTQAPYGLFRSASASIDPYTLITGEDVSVDPIDLSSPDITTIAIDSDSGPSCTKVSFDIRQFGTASLTFIFSPNLDLIKVFVTPTQVDWIHWVPLPRLTPTESYFHICGRDYLQALALFHLIPIWIALVSALVRSD